MAIKRCSSGKVTYMTQGLAEDALIDAWVRNNYTVGTGPVNIYQCEACSNFHFTSKGALHDRLKRELDSGQIERQRRAFQYERKFKLR